MDQPRDIADKLAALRRFRLRLDHSMSHAHERIRRTQELMDQAQATLSRSHEALQVSRRNDDHHLPQHLNPSTTMRGG